MTGKGGGHGEGRPHRDRGLSLMPRKTWLIRFKPSDVITEFVTASSAEIRGEHLVFLQEDGSLAALAVLESVESWSEVEPPRY
jgi:hypothetical protein